MRSDRTSEEPKAVAAVLRRVILSGGHLTENYHCLDSGSFSAVLDWQAGTFVLLTTPVAETWPIGRTRGIMDSLLISTSRYIPCPWIRPGGWASCPLHTHLRLLVV